MSASDNGAGDARSALVHGFPGWDLLPAHSLLLRRKPAGLRPVTVAPVAKLPPAASPPAAAPVTEAAPFAAATMSPSDAVAQSCPQCESPIEHDAAFCGECGTRLA